jgi:hypothetical protein
VLFIFWFYAVLLIVAPIVLRHQFRYNAKVDPRTVSLDELPAAARAYIDPHVADLAAWNFDLVAYVRISQVPGPVEAYMALLSNPHTAEWADVTFIKALAKSAGHVEFITRCSEQMQIDTNSNSVTNVFFDVPQYHIFQFPKVRDIYTLYRVHRMLVTEITHGKLPVLPPAGKEVAELARRLNRYGPWQQEHGYMYLDASAENYRLTWKGAILGAWRSIWPISVLRDLRQRNANRAILRRIGSA